MIKDYERALTNREVIARFRALADEIDNDTNWYSADLSVSRKLRALCDELESDYASFVRESFDSAVRGEGGEP